MIDFSKWNKEFGGEEARKALADAKNNDFTELPDGEYICQLEKLELGESSTHKPMVKGQFRVLEGAHRKQCLFLNQVFTRGFPQHKALEFLRDLNIFDRSEVDFDGDFANFNDLLLDMAEEAESMEFKIQKAKDGDFTRLTVLETYDK